MCAEDFGLKPSLRADNADGVSRFRDFHRVAGASNF